MDTVFFPASSNGQIHFFLFLEKGAFLGNCEHVNYGFFGDLEVIGLHKQFGVMTVLISVSFAYSEWVLLGALSKVSNFSEMMHTLSFTTCFSICCIAITPSVGLSMELASVTVGVSMVTFLHGAGWTVSAEPEA